MKHVEPVMGTMVSFDVRDEVPGAAMAAAIEWLHRVDRLFSTYRSDSEISRLARGEIAVGDCAAEVAQVLDLAAGFTRSTAGYFTTYPGGRLDPSGVVKGWAVQHASDLLRAAGSVSHAINGGGDIQLVGEAAPGRPWRVGIAHPLIPGRLATVVAGRDFAVATSGFAERGLHIVDPRTGRPAADLASITLVGADLTTIDAYATAAAAMGHAAREWVVQLEGIEAFAVTATGDIWCSLGWAEAGRCRRAGSEVTQRLAPVSTQPGRPG